MRGIGLLFLGIIVFSLKLSANQCRDLIEKDRPNSEWVAVTKSGRLIYKKTRRGDQIVDFSHAGYKGGGVAYPSVPTEVVLYPSGKDDTREIQDAIDYVSSLPLDKNGFRGQVRFAAGTFKLSGSLTIESSGVLLRGRGAGSTIFQVLGRPRQVIRFLGKGNPKGVGKEILITDRVVPSGETKINVKSTQSLKVGDEIIISREVSRKWVNILGMNKLVRRGKKQRWLTVGKDLKSFRTITKIRGKTIYLDAPITDRLDTRLYGKMTVQKYTFEGRLSDVGITRIGFHLVKPKVRYSEGEEIYRLLDFTKVKDAWVHRITANDFDVAITVTNGSRMTISHVKFKRFLPRITKSRARPAIISLQGQQILVMRSSSIGKDHYLGTQGNAQLNVVLDYKSDGILQPHQRWATGFLVDNANLKKAENIALYNRDIKGSGQGWTVGYGVMWNSRARNLIVQNPPGHYNWMIGSIGKIDKRSDGVIDQHNNMVRIRSLYLSQLCNRLGRKALKNIGY